MKVVYTVTVETGDPVAEARALDYQAWVDSLLNDALFGLGENFWDAHDPVFPYTVTAVRDEEVVYEVTFDPEAGAS